MKGRIKLVFLVLLLSLPFTACGDLQQLMDTAEGAMPKFKGGVPNLISGTWMVKSSSYEGTYVYRLTLKPDGTFRMVTVDDSTITGDYRLSYDHLDLLEASGTVVFSEAWPPRSQREMAFSYTADEDAGPRRLVLSGVAYSFVQR